MASDPQPSAGAPHHGFTNAIVHAFVHSNLSIVLILLAAAVGVAALTVTPREEEPQIVVPLANVFVDFPGHSAAEVEQLVATPLEKLLFEIDGVEYVYSMSREGQAVITVRFYVGQDRERSLVKLYKRIDEHADVVPPGVTGWVIKPVEIDDVPIVTLTLTSATSDEFVLRRVAEEMVQRLSAVEDLSRAYVIGGLPRVVHVYLDPAGMQAYGVSPLTIQRAIEASNDAQDAGRIVRLDRELRIEADGRVTRPEELRELVVAVSGDRPIFLKDVANVVDGAAEVDHYVRHGWGPARGFEDHEGAPGSVVGGAAVNHSSGPPVSPSQLFSEPRASARAEVLTANRVGTAQDESGSVLSDTAIDRADERNDDTSIGAGNRVEQRDAIAESDAAAESATPRGLKPAARFSDSTPAVTIAIAKKKGTNAVSVSRRILAEAESLNRQLVPDDVEMIVTRNYGLTANDKVNELVEALGVAIFIVIALLTLGLGWRESLIVALAVPVVFGLTLTVNLLFGYTINRVTLFALILSLGLLVDDPIVDVENISRHFRMHRRATRRIVLEAVAEIRPPLITATLAVIVSFLPMFFITGMMGPYMRPMALNVPVAMVMSMVVAFTITPWLSYHVLRRKYGGGGEVAGAAGRPDPAVSPGASASSAGAADGAVADPHDVGDVKESPLYRFFYPLMAPLLHSRAKAWAFLLVMGALTLAACGLAATRHVPLKMLPFDNKNELLLVINMDEGTTLERTDACVRDFEAYLQGVLEVTDYVSYVGLASPMDFNGLVRQYYLRRGDNVAEMRINLVGKKSRSMQSHAIGLRLRDDLTGIAERHDARLAIVEAPPGPPVVASIVAEVYGQPDHSYEDLQVAAATVRARLEREPGVVDVDDSIEADQTRLVFVPDKEKAALNGVSVAQIVATVRAAVDGAGAGTVQAPDERNPLLIELRLPRPLRSSAADLGQIHVEGFNGRLVPLAEIGHWEQDVADKTIYHKNMKRVAYVFAETAGRPPADAVVDIQADWRVGDSPVQRGSAQSGTAPEPRASARADGDSEPPASARAAGTSEPPASARADGDSEPPASARADGDSEPRASARADVPPQAGVQSAQDPSSIQPAESAAEPDHSAESEAESTFATPRGLKPAARLERVGSGWVSSASPKPVAGRTFLSNGGDVAWDLPPGIDVDFAGEGEWKITLDVFRDLGLAFAAALVGIYILLVAQTGSFMIPVVVMLAIPLNVLGIMPGFWLLNAVAGGTVGGYADPIFFTATGMIGMIALAGIVTRDAIILVDFIHLSQARGRSLFDAIMESRVVRLRPILLTAGTAMLSAAPIAIDPVFSGLAWSLIFGLFASTVFTLFVIPITYWLVYEKGMRA
ncbi:MAG: hypothetical protein C4547_07105 [Phycisphaerales bacterium]|nr:MAG: hypothetical protein C4547_07105 [Phycisphaerales bacterium]